MKHFLNFFEINTQSTSMINSHHTAAYEALSAHKFLAGFKTILPAYVVKSPQLQEEILVATLNPNYTNPVKGGTADGTDYYKH
jgi:hypothetical protein